MTHLGGRRRRGTSRAGLALEVVLALALGLGLVQARPAAADPDLTAARAKARALAQQVQQIEHQAEAATEAYDEVQDRLGSVVTAHLTTSQRLAELSAAADGAHAAATRRLRALYMSGGPAGLYAAVLRAGDIGDALTRADVVGRVLQTERSTLRRADDVVASTAELETQLERLAAERTTLEVRARADRQVVEDLLAQRQRALDSATATVARLVEEERARAEAEAAARAAARLATDPRAPVTLPEGTPEVVAAAVGAARAKVGAPYVYAATGPDAFDCSGLTQWAYRQAGVTLPRTSRQQWWVGPHPALADLLPGDLLFWASDPANPQTIHHVALYVGGGYMVHAPHPGDVVRVVPVYLDGYFGATRPW